LPLLERRLIVYLAYTRAAGTRVQQIDMLPPNEDSLIIQTYQFQLTGIRECVPPPFPDRRQSLFRSLRAQGRLLPINLDISPNCCDPLYLTPSFSFGRLNRSG